MAKKKRKSKGDGTPTFRCLNHGGKRKGAGRKAKRHEDGSRVEPSHAKRPQFTKSRPLHVTLEMVEDVPNLRAVNLASVVIDAVGRANVPYWTERELLIAPTQIPASIVRPAQWSLGIRWHCP